MDPRAGEGRVGILPWIGPPEKSRGRKQKGGREGGGVLIRGEREGEREGLAVREIGFSDLFCLRCLFDGVRGKEGAVVSGGGISRGFV